MTTTQSEAISVSNLKDFVRLAPIPLALLDRENRYVLASKRYEEFYQLPEDIVGKTPEELFPKFKNEWHEYHQEGLNGRHLKNKGLAESVELPSGATVYVKWEIHPWVRQGEIIGIITTIIPVTDYIHSIDERESTIRAFAHDIKGSFVQISNLIDIIFSESEYETEEFLPELTATVQYAGNLIDSFQQWVQTQQEEVQLEPIKVRELAEQAFRANFVAGEFVDEVRTDTVLLAGDSGKLSRLFGNLFSNAAKFRSKDVTPKVLMKLHLKSRGFWEIEVSDNSEGFDSEKYGALVVKPCERLNKTKEGTGMGLAIAQKVAEQHETSLDIYSRPGEGVTVRFCLREWGRVHE